jgi:hypothetical protein
VPRLEFLQSSMSYQENGIKWDDVRENMVMIG